MTAEMTHWERVRATLAGEEVDRPAISMWRHFYSRETDPESLAGAMLAYQKENDWDFLKDDVIPNTNVMLAGLDHYSHKGLDRLEQQKERRCRSHDKD